MKKFKVEGHLHLKGNSWCGKTEPSDIVKIYKEKGYDAIIVTNHFNVCLYNDYFKGTDEEKLDQFFKAFNELKANSNGLKVYFGVEFALGEDHYNLPLRKKCVELLVYGITPDEFREYGIKIISMDYKEFKALAEEKGWLVFQAHPFRERTKRVALDCIDGVETYNGNPRHVNRNLRAQAYCKHHKLLEVVGSDFHVPHDVSSAMMFYELPEDEKRLVSVLKEHKFDTLKGKRSIRK